MHTLAGPRSFPFLSAASNGLSSFSWRECVRERATSIRQGVDFFLPIPSYMQAIARVRTSCIHVSSWCTLTHNEKLQALPACTSYPGSSENQADRMMNLLRQSASVSTSSHWNYLSAVNRYMCVCVGVCTYSIFLFKFIFFTFNSIQGCRRKELNILVHS